MEKAIIFTGVEGTGQNRVESYQLLIGCNYISASYDNSLDRASFLEQESDAFVNMILEESRKIPLEVGVFNGLRIDSKTGNYGFIGAGVKPR